MLFFLQILITIFTIVANSVYSRTYAESFKSRIRFNENMNLIGVNKNRVIPSKTKSPHETIFGANNRTQKNNTLANSGNRSFVQKEGDL